MLKNHLILDDDYEKADYTSEALPRLIRVPKAGLAGVEAEKTSSKEELATLQQTVDQNLQMTATIVQLNREHVRRTRSRLLQNSRILGGFDDEASFCFVADDYGGGDGDGMLKDEEMEENK